MSTGIGDIYHRTVFGDHVLIIGVQQYPNDVYQFQWYELESGVYGTYTLPFGDDLERVGTDVFRLVA